MSDEYTPRQPDEHRLMANMLRVLGGNRALADQVIAEIEDSLWLAAHDAEVARQQAEHDARIADEQGHLWSGSGATAAFRVADKIRDQFEPSHA